MRHTTMLPPLEPRYRETVERRKAHWQRLYKARMEAEALAQDIRSRTQIDFRAPPIVKRVS